MAIEDQKLFDIRGYTVKVTAKRMPGAVRSYIFEGIVKEHTSSLHVFIGEEGDLQEHVNTARFTVAEQAVSEIEHLDGIADVD